MDNMQKMIVVSPATKTRLEEIKLIQKKAGQRSTMGGIVDKLVSDEYDRVTKKADVV